MENPLALEQRPLRLTGAPVGDLEIALSGGAAKVERHGLLQPGRRCVETSGYVIEGFLRAARQCVELYFAPQGGMRGLTIDFMRAA